MLGCALVLVVGCGGTSATTDTSADEGRLISGEIATDTAAMVAKAVGVAGSCIGEVCGIMAQNSAGESVSGEIDPATNRWQVRVRAGNWMFGFLDGAGNRLGYLYMNGIGAVTIDDGDDVELGRMQLRDGAMVMEQDAEGLGLAGIHTYRYQDRNRNGQPDDFEGDTTPYDPSVFDVLMVRPFDAQPHVAPCRPVKVIFNAALDDATVTADTIKVTLNDGTSVTGTLSVWEDAEYGEYEVTFATTGGYPMGAVITVVVVAGPDGVLSETGDALPAEASISFTVRDFGGTSFTCHDPDGELQQERLRLREAAGGGSGGAE